MQTADAGALTLAEVVDAAARGLDVRIARQQLAASRADLLAADHAPLPVLSAKAAASDQPLLRGGPGPASLDFQRRNDRQLGLDWTWERGDKRSLRTEVARSAIATSQADLAETTLQQRLAAKDAFFDLLAAQQAEQHAAANAQTALELAELARRRLAAGDVSAQDASRVEIEAQRARADLDAARLERQRAALALALLTGPQLRPAPAAQWQVAEQWPQPAAFAAADSQSWIDSRPDIRAAQARLAAAQAQLEAAAALKRADPTLGLSLDPASGASRRLVELRVQLPLSVNYSYEGEIGRAQALREQAQQALDKTRLAAASEWSRLQQELAQSAQRLQVYDDNILPRARQVAAQAELAYAKGALPLFDLLDARRTLRAVQLEALGVRTGHAKAATSWQMRSSSNTEQP